LRDLSGALILSLVFGSIHAFSALLMPLEDLLAGSRTDVSLGYSLAIASLTCGVFAAPGLFRLPPSALALLSGAVASVGVGLAAIGQSLALFLAGYGILFGFANGIAYSLFLNRAAHAMPQATGWSAGLVTAAYGLGAALFAAGFNAALLYVSVKTVLFVLAGIIAMAGLGAALLFRGGSAGAAARLSAGRVRPPRLPLLRLWTVYFLGAAGGLMVIAHAAGIVMAAGLGASMAAAAPTAVALGNIAGSLVGGPWGAAQKTSFALAGPLAGATISMVLLLFVPLMSLAALMLCGMAYGALIAAVPAVIRKLAGDHGFAFSFGRVFTAWGVAGLSGPISAGALFDAYATYSVAVGLGLTAAVAGMFIAYFGLRSSDA
jgi:hypothetical protein